MFEPFNVLENGSDGKASIFAAEIGLPTYETRAWNKTIIPHKIDYGATIPGTGFRLVLSNVADNKCPTILLSDHALACWKRLWHLRSNSRHILPKVSTSKWTSGTTVRGRARNLDGDFVDSAIGDDGPLSIVLVLTFFTYGGMHLLAWQYNFQTDIEGLLWRIASIITASSGLIIFISQIGSSVQSRAPARHPLRGVTYAFLSIWMILGMLLFWFEVVARSFLIVESFKALPNSPPSVYEVPRWTAYLPHV